ncbi:hypothetical protein [Thalassomonas haliotis]|nr:hypothetical protein [Thalassomonas haliotis]
MRELHINEIQEINGGIPPLAVYALVQAGNVYAWYSFAKSMR